MDCSYVIDFLYASLHKSLNNVCVSSIANGVECVDVGGVLELPYKGGGRISSFGIEVTKGGKCKRDVESISINGGGGSIFLSAKRHCESIVSTMDEPNDFQTTDRRGLLEFHVVILSRFTIMMLIKVVKLDESLLHTNSVI